MPAFLHIQTLCSFTNGKVHLGNMHPSRYAQFVFGTILQLSYLYQSATCTIITTLMTVNLKAIHGPALVTIHAVHPSTYCIWCQVCLLLHSSREYTCHIYLADSYTKVLFLPGLLKNHTISRCYTQPSL